MNKKRTFWYSLLVSLVLLTCWPALAAGATVRSISISPLAFCRDTTSTDFRTNVDFAGLQWIANSTQTAGFYLSRPPDWDGVTPVKVTITFAQLGSNACSINWQLKLNSYTPNSGQPITNPPVRNADAILNIAAGAFYRVLSQTFTLPATDFNSNTIWSVFFLRGNSGNGETFTGYLFVLNAEVRYNATNQAVVIPLGN
jgi:hypothetical protein